MELVRKAYRRPLEVWLVADLAMYLEENGYDAEIRTLCAKEVTPRNMVVVGVRKIQDGKRGSEDTGTEGRAMGGEGGE